MKKIKNRHEIIGGKIKYLNSKMMNMSFALGVTNNTINSIFNLINTSIYLNNDNPNSHINPYQTNNIYMRMGSDIRHSSFSHF